MKGKKLIKKILLGIVAVICAAAIIFGGVVFMYYPHYKKSKSVAQLASEGTADEIRVMSCNVRCINPIDFGKTSWYYRADLIIKNIEKYYPGIIGFQEVTKRQYNYLSDCLPQYSHEIVYRDESSRSEGCPIFYNKSLYKLVDIGSFWLSETPDVMSKSWNSAYNRICGYVILETIESGEQFVVFNTHLDHKSADARINGIKVILNKIEEFGSLPAVIMGDFNCEEDSDTYKAATELFLDAKYQTSEAIADPSLTFCCTYQKFGKELDRENIDYFMISKEGFDVLLYQVITDTYDGVYTSDHFPIMTILKLSEVSE